MRGWRRLGAVAGTAAKAEFGVHGGGAARCSWRHRRRQHQPRPNGPLTAAMKRSYRGATTLRALVEFAILGPLEARANREPIPLGGPKQRALLAMLLLEAGRVVSLDRLVEALWEGNPPPTAVASLQNFVAQLRKALGPDVIETLPPGYLVRLGAEQLDLARVRSLVDAARASEPVQRSALLDDALG